MCPLMSSVKRSEMHTFNGSATVQTQTNEHKGNDQISLSGKY